MSQVLETDDLVNGEVTEIALVNRGDGVNKVRVTAVTGGGGGGVTAVTGTAPITSSGGATPAIGITAATDVAAGSMSSTDKTKLDGYGVAPALLVFAPTGTPGGNVFTSFASLKAVADALAAVDTPVEVFFQGAACTIPAGAWNFTNPDVVFRGNGIGSTTLTFAVGSTLSGVATFEDLTLVSLATAPVISFTSGTNAVFFFDTALNTSSASPFFGVSGAGTIFNLNLQQGSSIGDGTNPFITTGAGATSNVLVFQAASTNTGFFAGAGTNVTFVFDESASVVTPYTLLTTAQLLGYNDSLVAPPLGANNVQSAIDDLKSGNVPPILWVAVAAGATPAVAAQKAPQFFAVDTSAVAAAATLVTFPAHGTAVDGQEVTITLEGSTVSTPVSLAPGTSNQMGDPNNAGQYGTVAPAAGSTLTAGTVGQVIKRKYSNATSKWRPF